ncbi:MAG TPA: prepilin-type N-terminal cleavage/methylation domain-containing protein [Planctomycetota bacterium]|nr:prepilin-type N-terminal cleavage/methylation domain-containing protein [Planctomycetota bacterium]
MTPYLTVRSAIRQGFTLIELLVVIAIIAILAAIIIPAVMRVQSQAANAKDLEQVRGMGNGFSLYNKRYNHFPAMCNMSDPAVVSISTARTADAPKGIALKLLVLGAYIEDVKVFFSPRESSPTPQTLQKMQAELDPNKGAVGLQWASTYAYDSGHNTFHGITPMFGNRHGWLLQNSETAHVLSCEQIAKEIEPDASGVAWTLPNHKANNTATAPDDIYADEVATFDWRDSYLAEPANTGL